MQPIGSSENVNWEYNAFPSNNHRDGMDHAIAIFFCTKRCIGTMGRMPCIHSEWETNAPFFTQ